MTLSRIFHWVAVAFLFFVLLSPAILFSSGCCRCR